jgi:hypothetical protein
VEEWHNDDDDDDEDIDINDDGLKAPNDNFHEPQPQNINPTICHASTSIIIRVFKYHDI